MEELKTLDPIRYEVIFLPEEVKKKLKDLKQKQKFELDHKKLIKIKSEIAIYEHELQVQKLINNIKIYDKNPKKN